MEDMFNFSCQKTGNCCNKMEIFLNPFDILEIASCKGITTSEVIDRYVIFLENAKQGIQRPIFKEARNGFCSFNENKLCTIHMNRPLSCRLFPLNRKNGKLYNSNSSFCKGLKVEKEITIDKYITGEGLKEYIEGADLYHNLIEDLTKKYDFSKIDYYLKSLFFIILYDFDRVFVEYTKYDLSSMEKLKLSLHVAKYLGDNYFSLSDYSKEELLNNIFNLGDSYIDKNIKG